MFVVVVAVVVDGDDDVNIVHIFHVSYVHFIHDTNWYLSLTYRCISFYLYFSRLQSHLPTVQN